MRAYTDLEQSKKLAEILPLESADMCYPLPCNDNDKPLLEKGGFGSIPCWSLAALLDVLPYHSLHKTFSGWRCDTYDKDGASYLLGEYAETQVDACVAMIEKFHKQKLL